MSNGPTKCSQCDVLANRRLWKRGLERWCYETYRRGTQVCKRWFCAKCGGLTPEAKTQLTSLEHWYKNEDKRNSTLT